MHLYLEVVIKSVVGAVVRGAVRQAGGWLGLATRAAETVIAHQLRNSILG